MLRSSVDANIMFAKKTTFVSRWKIKCYARRQDTQSPCFRRFLLIKLPLKVFLLLNNKKRPVSTCRWKINREKRKKGKEFFQLF